MSTEVPIPMPSNTPGCEGGLSSQSKADASTTPERQYFHIMYGKDPVPRDLYKRYFICDENDIPVMAKFASD